MSETSAIIAALKYWNAGTLKSLQRRLTTAKNTINQDVLSFKLRPFFSEAEIQALSGASRILGQVKSKIEHAKEVKVREEKRREELLKKCKAMRIALLKQYLPEPTTASEDREAMLWSLALDLHHPEISSAYYRKLEYFVSSLDRALDAKRGHNTLQHFIKQCWQDVHDWLEEELWHYDKEPDPEKLLLIIGKYEKTWRQQVLDSPCYQGLIRRYDEAVAIKQSSHGVKL